MDEQQWTEFYNEMLDLVTETANEVGIDPNNYDDDGIDPLRELLVAIKERVAFRDVGVGLIAVKRMIQVAKGYTPEHDDAHVHGEMLRTAICYAVSAMTPDTTMNGFNKAWQVDTVNGLWPSICNTMHGSDIERLEDAGALIAAEIGRRKRLVKEQGPALSDQETEGSEREARMRAIAQGHVFEHMTAEEFAFMQSTEGTEE